MPRKSSRPRRAYSLVDLVVVIGAVGLMIMVVLPTARQIREQARAVQCATNVRQVGISLQGYASAYRGVYPPNFQFPAPGNYWYDLQRAGGAVAEQSAPSPSKVGGAAMACPSDEGGRRSYAMNFWASGAVDGTLLTAIPTARLWSARVGDASQMILVVEAWSGQGSAEFGWFSRATVGYGPETAGRRFGGAGGLVPMSAGRFGSVNCEIDFARHRQPSDGGVGDQALGRAHFGYADGHVAMRLQKELIDANGTSTGDSRWHANEQR